MNAPSAGAERRGAQARRPDSETALLRRAFGPQPGALEPHEEEALREFLRQRAVPRPSARHDAVRHDADPGAGDATRDRLGPLGGEGPGEPVPDLAGRGPARPATRALVRQRLLASAIGAAVAASVLGVGAGIWSAVQPRPAVVLHGEHVSTAEVENLLAAQAGAFDGFSITDGMSYGQAYGLRVIGARLTSAERQASLDCLWFLDSSEFVMPLCSGVQERPGYPRLLDIWRIGEELAWNPSPSDDLRQIRISVQGDQLELWEQAVQGSS